MIDRFKSASIFILIFWSSCTNNETIKTIEKETILTDYSIEMTFSSFWNCGEFKKYVLYNNLDGDPWKREVFKKYSFYTVNTRGKCKPPIKTDTLVVKLTKNQSDSLFGLANKFIDSFNLNNHVKENQMPDAGVSDGASVTIEIGLLNKLKSATYNHYGHLKDISKEMKFFIEYIDFLNNIR